MGGDIGCGSQHGPESLDLNRVVPWKSLTRRYFNGAHLLSQRETAASSEASRPRRAPACQGRMNAPGAPLGQRSQPHEHRPLRSARVLPRPCLRFPPARAEAAGMAQVPLAASAERLRDGLPGHGTAPEFSPPAATASA